MLSKIDILNLYKKYNVKASKKFGQNFLHDENIINKIITESHIKDKAVIEIGPGLGSLTSELIKVASKVKTYEIDEDMKMVIEGEIKSPKLELIFKDFLDENFSSDDPKIIVSNIPYNITSPILFKLFKNSCHFTSATLMVQKEVGERILANPSESNYGKLTVTSNYFANISKIVSVSSDSFVPAPKVDSIVIKLDFLNQEYNYEFIDFIKNCFSQQRKKLINNLKGIYDTEKIKKILKDLNINDTIRPQQLDLTSYKEIYNKL